MNYQAQMKISETYRIIKDSYRQEIMTEDEMKEIDDFITVLNENKGSMSNLYSRWEEEEEAYLSDQPIEEDLPNSRMNIVLSSIEGMVSQLVDQNISVVAKGEGPEDEQYAEWGKVVLEWAFRKNQINNKVATHERRRMKFGNAWFKVVWCDEFAGGFGLPKLMCPPLNKVFIDTKVKDYFRLEEADYIAETINCSKSFAYETYGKDKANIIDFGENQYTDNGIFDEDYDATELDNSWTLIQWWSIYEGKLRLRELTGCGVLLWDSCKSGDRKANQKNNDMKKKSFYKYVYDKYPYFFTSKYPQEGSFYGIGDGKLLMPLQKMLNELYDKIRIIMRPNIIGIDEHSGINAKELDDNSFNPVYYDGAKLNNRPPFQTIQWGQVGNDMWQLINMVHEEAQRIVRFSDIMIGQGKQADTATESAIMQQQGNSHTDHEKTVLEITLAEVAKYMLGLMMEKYTEGNASGKAFRITGDETEQFMWIDFKEMTEIPAQIPATRAYRNKFMEKNPGAEIPKWQNLENKSTGKITKSVELDIQISVGSGLPKNKAFIWQMVEKLSQLTGIDIDSGQPIPKPAVTWKELRKFIKDFLGVPIRESNEDMEKFQQAMEQMKQQVDSMQAGAEQRQGMPGPQGGPRPGAPNAATPLPQANAPLQQSGQPTQKQPQGTVGAY